MDAIPSVSKALATYYVSRDRDGEVADCHVVSEPLKLDMHQPFKAPPEEGHFGNPCRH